PSVSSSYPCPPPDLPSFPTRRSSDLPLDEGTGGTRDSGCDAGHAGSQRVARLHPLGGPRWRHGGSAAVRARGTRLATPAGGLGGDRKSTRLNSSHVKISYAVFCLKKK